MFLWDFPQETQAARLEGSEFAPRNQGCWLESERPVGRGLESREGKGNTLTTLPGRPLLGLVHSEVPGPVGWLQPRRIPNSTPRGWPCFSSRHPLSLSPYGLICRGLLEESGLPAEVCTDPLSQGAVYAPTQGPHLHLGVLPA